MDALYEVGSHYLRSKDYPAAIEAYQQFIYNYPREAKVETAMLAIARCHVETKAWDKALDAYQRFLNKFPGSEYAPFAESKVQWIRTYHY